MTRPALVASPARALWSIASRAAHWHRDEGPARGELGDQAAARRRVVAVVDGRAAGRCTSVDEREAEQRAAPRAARRSASSTVNGIAQRRAHLAHGSASAAGAGSCARLRPAQHAPEDVGHRRLLDRAPRLGRLPSPSAPERREQCRVRARRSRRRCVRVIGDRTPSRPERREHRAARRRGHRRPSMR